MAPIGRRWSSTRVALSIALLCILVGRRAAAEPVDPQQIAVAQALVDEGRRLLSEGKVEEACPKFKEAVRLTPGSGIGALAQLAECYEKAGHLASAWGTWAQVESASRTAGQVERTKAAHDHVNALAARVPKLLVVVAESLRSQEGLEIARDGVAVPREQWGVAIPVDPGRHAVGVRATGKVGWSVDIDVQSGEVQIVAPAHLEDAPSTAVAAKSTPAPPPEPLLVTTPAPHGDNEPGRLQRRVALGVGLAGFAALEVGAVLLVVNVTKNADDNAVCNQSPTPASCGTEAGPGGLRAGSQTTRTGAIVSGIVGAAGLGGGILLYATAPSSRGATAASASHFTAMLGLGGAAAATRW